MREKGRERERGGESVCACERERGGGKCMREIERGTKYERGAERDEKRESERERGDMM